MTSWHSPPLLFFSHFSTVGKIAKSTPILTSYSHGKWQSWEYQNSETPEPTVTKYGVGDYGGNVTQQAKIQTDSPSGGVPAIGGKFGEISLSHGLYFVVCDQNFCSRPKIKPENRFLCCLVHRMLIPGSYILRVIKLQKKFDFLNFYPPKDPERLWIGIFKPNAQIIKTCILSKLLHGFQPNFAQW